MWPAYPTRPVSFDCLVEHVSVMLTMLPARSIQSTEHRVCFQEMSTLRVLLPLSGQIKPVIHMDCLTATTASDGDISK